MSQNKTWVLTANEAQAKLFKIVQFPKIEQIHSFEHPESRLQNHELVSSKPGRSFDRMGTNRHTYEPKSDPQSLEIEKFAKELNEYLSKALQNKEFDHLYLFAGPYFLGVFRQHLCPHVAAKIKAEVPKDLVKQEKGDIEALIESADIL